MIRLSVILPTRNPHPGRLARTLAGLAAQTLARDVWEVVLVDNGSHPPLATPSAAAGLPEFRIVHEETAGLTPARRRGLGETRGELIVFVDDDNVLAPAYLETALGEFDAHPRLGAAGGPVRPEWETPPPVWIGEFAGLLALHEHGEVRLSQTGGPAAPWPAFAPVGAGLCVRRAATAPYLEALRTDPRRLGLDRRAGSLASGGDNDLVFTLLQAGWDVAYVPALGLVHLMPAGRIEPGYLARLNQGIQRSWVRVLALHGERPWPAIPGWSVPLRSARAWVRVQAWSSPVNRIRWHGLRGRFQGQADLAETSPR